MRAQPNASHRIPRRILLLLPLLAGGGLLAHDGATSAARPGQDPEKAPLSLDGSVAEVVDREGVAMQRPVNLRRWSHADERARLAPGTWLRAGTRGANALLVALDGGGELLLGPGALVELVDAHTLRHTQGEIQVVPADDTPIVVHGPGRVGRNCTEGQTLRATRSGLDRLDPTPQWVDGYRSNQSTEALGSLLAQVDGRDVALTLGYHKVTVDIRDQIARTVIEESFVNQTGHTLEGIFYFPLPADASISSFGMWIGDELVQGDIVEKQRARAIYEQILREKRDPGLLEWTGGNVFQARVYPIHREKRIKISYTQFLPKRNGGYDYHYALQSELLQQHPLEELRLDVTVHSDEPLVSVNSWSHECRIRSTEHAASVEFDAQDFTPTRDFQLRVQTASDSGVRFVPHRRGEDGYFLASFELPHVNGIARDPGGGKDFLVLADTSGSMHGAARERQISFVEALLSALGDEDRLQLMTVDHEVRAAFESAVPPSADAREEALRFLEAREPLGWTNLDAALARAAELARPDTQVIYVGDGIPTTGDADPASFAQRTADLYRGQGSFHVVVPGGKYETLACRAIARLGGGSLRVLQGEIDPARAALDLLEELNSLGVRDLEVRFEGLPAAAVYPSVLPNLPRGRQHVVVGRYDPSWTGDTGAVVVRGTIDGEFQEWRTEVRLDPQDVGNSFLPRLWARQHLDHLLGQKGSPGLQERIIGLSEDFQIITPHTSFLVLESEEDRERFQVEKRFRMRDGEEFFAKGRDDATEALVQKQMRAAKGWRLELRRDVLRGLSTMHRELTERLRATHGDLASFESNAGAYGGFGGGGENEVRLGFTRGRGYRGPSDAVPPSSGARPLGSIRRESLPAERARSGEDLALRELGYDSGDWDEESANDLELFEELDSLEEDFAFDDDARSLDGRASRSRMAKRAFRPPATAAPSSPAFYGESFGRRQKGLSQSLHAGFERHGPFGGWMPLPGFLQLFPQVPDARAELEEPAWPEEIQRIVSGWDRRATIREWGRGLRIRTSSFWRDHRDRPRDGHAGLLMIEGSDWLQIAGRSGNASFLFDWVDEENRGRLDAGARLGRTRPREDGDAAAWMAPWAWWFGDRFAGMRNWDVRREEADENVLRLVFTNPVDPDHRIQVDGTETKPVIFSVRSFRDEEEEYAWEFADFVQIADVYWPQAMVRTSSDGTQTTTNVRILAGASFSESYAAESARIGESIVIGDLPESVAAAKQAVAEDGGSLEDRLALLVHFASSQQWEEARAHYEEILRRESSKHGVFPLTMVWLEKSRRHEQLHSLLRQYADLLVGGEREGEYTLAQSIWQKAAATLAANDRMALLDRLAPLYERQPPQHEAQWWIDHQRASLLDELQRFEEAFALRRANRAEHPTVVEAHRQVAEELMRRSEDDEAVEILREAEESHGPWLQHERLTLRRSRVNALWGAYRLREVIETVGAWNAEEDPSVEVGFLEQYLVAHVFLDRLDEAKALASGWIDATLAAPTDDAGKARLNAAVNVLLGSSGHFYVRRLDDERADTLARVAAGVLEREEFTNVSHLYWNWHWRTTERAQAFFVELFARLEAEVETAEAEQVRRFAAVLQHANFQPGGRSDGWTPILEAILERWRRAEAPLDRQLLATLLRSYGSSEQKLALFRERLARAEDEPQRLAAARELFAALLEEEWSESVEDELARLLPHQRWGATDENAAEADLAAQIVAVYDLASWMVRARTEATVAALPDRNSMPRRVLKAATEEARAAARDAVIEKLPGLAEGLPAPLAAWTAIERDDLRVKRKQELAAVFSENLDGLRADAEAFAADARGRPLARAEVLASRRAATLAWILFRMEPEERATREADLLALADRLDDAGNELLDWRALVYSVLVALDRGDAVEGRLAQWYGDGDDFETMRWGRDLAYVLAERGDLENALRALEALGEKDELSKEDLQAMADWALVLDRKELARDLRVRAWETVDEWTLANLVEQHWRRLRDDSSGVPGSLDPVVAEQLTALLRKSESPANRVWIAERLFDLTKDFRVLACLPEAVLGRSAQHVYPFLSQIRGVVDGIEDEATYDRVVAHLETLSATADKVDLRALRLLEYQVARAAAEQAHGTRDHELRALAALRASFRESWADGEPLAFATFHAAAPALQPASLIEEQLSQVRQVLATLTPGSEDRFHVAHQLAILERGAGQRERSARTSEAAVAELRARTDGRLPQYVDRCLVDWSQDLRALSEHAAMERIWLRELEEAYPAARAADFRELLYRSWVETLADSGRNSLGDGRALYRAARDRMVAEILRRTDEDQAEDYLLVLCDLLREAHEKFDDDEPGRDARSLAFEHLPRVLDLYQHRNSDDMVSRVSDMLLEVRSRRDAVEFLVTRAENEAAWLAYAGSDFWAEHAWRFANALHEARGLGAELDQRALAVVLRELRSDLRSGRSRSRSVYDVDNYRFWRPHRADFHRAAMAVVAEPKIRASERLVLHGARYLYHDLHSYADAVDVLLDARGPALLGLNGTATLVEYLQGQERWEESIVPARELVAERPELTDDWRRLMFALHHTGRGEELEGTRARAEAWFKENGHWSNEHVVRALADACLETRLYASAAEWFEEAIAIHVRVAPNRGVGGGTLGEDYRKLAASYSGLGRTREAVDAAAGAIVAWGPSQNERKAALENLRSVLRRAVDFDAYVASLEEEIVSTGLENPILRKALGEIELERQHWAQAVRHLSAARLAAPEDTELYALLAKALDGAGNWDAATEQLLAGARSSGHAVEPWIALGERFEDVDLPASERAYTQLAEVFPHESQGHEALAEKRIEQRRWEEAAHHWRQVIRVRTDEPTGYLGLARALVAQRDWDEAGAVVNTLLEKEWPEHFGDVHSSARLLLGSIGGR